MKVDVIVFNILLIAMISSIFISFASVSVIGLVGFIPIVLVLFFWVWYLTYPGAENRIGHLEERINHLFFLEGKGQ